MALSAAVWGWAAFFISCGVTLSGLPLVVAARKRGHLNGENTDPWVTGFVRNTAFAVYAFNEAANSGLQLRLWCVEDMLVQAFVCLTALRLTADPARRDAYDLILWAGAVLSYLFVAWGSLRTQGWYMVALATANSASVLTSLHRVASSRRVSSAIDPVLCTARVCSGLLWCAYALITSDFFVFVTSGFSLFCAAATLVVWALFHPRCFGLPTLPPPKDTDMMFSEEAGSEEAGDVCPSSPKVVAARSTVAASAFGGAHVLPSEATFALTPHRSLHDASPKPFGATGAFPPASGGDNAMKIGVGGGSALDCSVCLVELGADVGNDASVILRCGHRFCAPCLQKCSTAGMSACPTCRHPHELSPEVLANRASAFRSGYKSWRMGSSRGARGEIDDISAAEAVL